VLVVACVVVVVVVVVIVVVVLVVVVLGQPLPSPPHLPHASTFAEPPHTPLQSTATKQFFLQSNNLLSGHLHGPAMRARRS
jgi:hypothetical protein